MRPIDINLHALDRAIQFHLQGTAPNAETIIETAKKFVSFLLIEKKTMQPRGGA